MGYEYQLKYGAAGSTASTLIENCRDANYSIGISEGTTTVKGDGSAPPIECSRVTGRQPRITWTMLHKTTDTTLTALRAAAAAGTPVALRAIPLTGGTGFDGDVNLSVEHGAPIGGEQSYNFTASPNNESRTPALNS